MKDRDIEVDIFGYESLSYFLWAFGTQVFAVAVGALLWLSASFHPKKSKSKKYFRYLSALVMGVGFFFIGWVFLDNEYFSEQVEIVGSIIFAITASGIFSLFLAFLSSELTSIKELKETFFDYILEFRLHYKKLLANTLHRNEQYKATLDRLEEDLYNDSFEEMIKKDTESTEKSMKQKAKEIDEWDV